MVDVTMQVRPRPGKHSSRALRAYLSGANAPRRYNAASAALLRYLPDLGDAITIEDAISIVEDRGPDAVISIFRLIEGGSITADVADNNSGDMSIVLRRIC